MSGAEDMYALHPSYCTWLARVYMMGVEARDLKAQGCIEAQLQMQVGTRGLCCVVPSQDSMDERADRHEAECRRWSAKEALGSSGVDPG